MWEDSGEGNRYTILDPSQFLDFPWIRRIGESGIPNTFLHWSGFEGWGTKMDGQLTEKPELFFWTFDVEDD